MLTLMQHEVLAKSRVQAKTPSKPPAAVRPSPQQGLPAAVPLPAPPTAAPVDVKPKLEALLKPKSIRKVLEDYDVVTNSTWNENDFSFVNAGLVRTPLEFAWPRILDFSLYPKMSSAIQKLEFDPRAQLLEIVGEKHGLRMHSWIKVDQRYFDFIRYEVVRGDLVGFKVDAYLYEQGGKTLAVATGKLPGAKQMLPTFVELLFKPVSEIVLSVATKNFRSYIEEEYQKQRNR